MYEGSPVTFQRLSPLGVKGLLELYIEIKFENETPLSQSTGCQGIIGIELVRFSKPSQGSLSPLGVKGLLEFWLDEDYLD